MTTVPNTIFTELSKAGALFLVLGAAVYFLYTDNRNYQMQVEQRLIRLETMYYDCITENKELSQKNFQLLEEKINKDR
jgi:hypothetical protein